MSDREVVSVLSRDVPDSGRCRWPRRTQDLYTLILPSALYMPTRVPQGMLNATAFFQSTISEALQGIYSERCMVRVDNII